MQHLEENHINQRFGNRDLNAGYYEFDNSIDLDEMASKLEDEISQSDEKRSLNITQANGGKSKKSFLSSSNGNSQFFVPKEAEEAYNFGKSYDFNDSICDVWPDFDYEKLDRETIKSKKAELDALEAFKKELICEIDDDEKLFDNKIELIKPISRKKTSRTRSLLRMKMFAWGRKKKGDESFKGRRDLRQFLESKGVDLRSEDLNRDDFDQQKQKPRVEIRKKRDMYSECPEFKISEEESVQVSRGASIRNQNLRDMIHSGIVSFGMLAEGE